MGKKKLPQKLQDWVRARAQFHLSDVHVQMARELGLNPKKLGKIANHKQEPWKAPLPEFIEHLYEKRFGRPRPELVMSIEERARVQRAQQQVKEARKEGSGPGREGKGMGGQRAEPPPDGFGELQPWA